MLQGGLMTGDAVLLAGSAGTGKTTIGLQSLVNGIEQYQDNGIYVTFEQLPDQIYRDAASFGWDLKKLEADGKLKVVCTSPDLLIGEEVGGILDEPIRTLKPRRIVLDSLSHIAMFVDESRLRQEAYRLIMYLKTKGLSSILLWESPQLSGQGFAVSEVGMSFLVDCIILLRFVEIESSMRKAITITKMRGSNHDKSLREYEITSKGVAIAAPFSQYEGIITGTPTRSAPDKFVEMFSKAAKGK
jgi:circadian clock protein KaiC